MKYNRGVAAHNWIMVCECVLQKHCLLQLDNLSQVKKGKLCNLVLGKDLGFLAFLISLADPTHCGWHDWSYSFTSTFTA